MPAAGLHVAVGAQPTELVPLATHRGQAACCCHPWRCDLGTLPAPGKPIVPGRVEGTGSLG